MVRAEHIAVPPRCHTPMMYNVDMSMPSIVHNADTPENGGPIDDVRYIDQSNMPSDAPNEPSWDNMERALIGTLIMFPENNLGRASAQVIPEYFTSPARRLLFQMVQDTHAQGIPITADSILHECAARHSGNTQLIGELQECVNSLASDDISVFVQLLAERHCAQSAQRTARKLIASLQTNSRSQPVDEIIEQAVHDLKSVWTPNTTVVEGLMTIDQFMAQDLKQQWIIPGLMEATDRAVLVGYEGRGKSMLLRQIALCTAAGVHPFDQSFMEPIRVLYVDMENSASLVQRKITPILQNLEKMRRPIGDRCSIWCWPAGLDLTNHHDRAQLIAACEHTKAQLLVIGPLYKMMRGNPNEEEVAMSVTRVLDHIRATFNMAIFLEAHAPQMAPGGHRDLRPVASSVWMRWPEFGLALRPKDAEFMTMELEHWRGARDERFWPHALRQGDKWPWEPMADSAPLPPPDMIQAMIDRGARG